MKNLRQILLSLLFLLALLFALVYGQKNLTCQANYRNDSQIKIDSRTLKIEVANTETSREKGLSGRSCIGANQGMLFVFAKPGYYPFWMKDMKFSIDMVWANSNKRVVYIQPNVQPSTYPQSFTNQEPAKYVLELQAGNSAKLGISVGSQLKF